MAQIFYINHNSVLPTLRVELVNDGRFDFLKAGKFYNAIQNAEITFSMEDETGVLKVADAPCNIVLATEKSCEDRYIIEYKWKERDTKKKGKYKAQFKIKFNPDIYEEGVEYPDGDLIMPIYEDLYVMIK